MDKQKVFKVTGVKTLDNAAISTYEQYFRGGEEIREEAIVQAMYLESEGYNTNVKEIDEHSTN